MEFIYGKQDFCNMERAQENCYLLTNGLGGYSSLTAAGSCARNDHALLMAGVTAPTGRYHLLSRMEERICAGNRKSGLSSQEYVNYTKNEKGYVHINSFSKDIFPVWVYQAEGVEVKKMLVMKHGENTLGIRYEIQNDTSVEIRLVCTPWMQFVEKGETPASGQCFELEKKWIASNGIRLYYKTDGKVKVFASRRQDDLYYGYDARDGRPAVGRTIANHEIEFTVPPGAYRQSYIVYSMEEEPGSVESLFRGEELRQEELLQKAALQDSVGRQLVKSSDCFLTDRTSTGEKTIVAGYPFFGDWGRDTMIAVLGVGIAAGRFEETKSIFRSFLQYCKGGLMPNMFPESGRKPIYNTVDASLLFIMAVYEYYKKTEDREFVREAWGQMQEVITWYTKGTDYHIRMDTDGLLTAGSGLEQVTWMDIRYGDILPTPRHGKPVEINAWWYNALKILETFAVMLGEDETPYKKLAEQVKTSFRKAFWNEREGCLKDTVSGKEYDMQVRCNQIWVVSAPFSILERGQEQQVVRKVWQELYTPYGLRTLSPADIQFCPLYKGSTYERDMAYHQGTAWPFPLGAYYLAYLKVHDYSREARERVRMQLVPMQACLREGCVGQLAEVYDGGTPGPSKGCFAQAWSVGEILRVYAALEDTV